MTFFEIESAPPESAVVDAAHNAADEIRHLREYIKSLTTEYNDNMLKAVAESEKLRSVIVELRAEIEHLQAAARG
jgi:uncharacterized coiled-coil DUF342 family protein